MNEKPRISKALPWVLWAGAIGFGVLGVAGTRGYINENLETERARLASEHRKVPTVVASRDLAAGALVDAQVMAVRDMPAGFLPAAAVRAANFESYLGKRLLIPMTSGQALLATAVAGADGAFSGQVRHGIRAMTIEVDEVNSVSGMLSPGDRIDLLFSTRPPDAFGSLGAEITTPLMQDMHVLATGQRTRAGRLENGEQTFATITVEVTPEQGQKLVLAQQSGRLTAMLRNPQDRRATHNAAMDVYQLLGIEPPKPGVSEGAGPQIIVGGMGRLEAQILPLPAKLAPDPGGPGGKRISAKGSPVSNSHAATTMARRSAAND